MAEGGIKLVKYSLFLFNLLFVIAGIVLIYLGVSTNARINAIDQLVNLSTYSVPSKIFIGVGIVMFVIAFLGCCGSVKESHAMVMTYSVLVGLVLVIQIGAAVAAYYKSDEITDLVKQGLKDTLPKYGNDTETRRLWDYVQHNVHCCGVNDYRDWFEVTSVDPLISGKVPDSCCLIDSVGCASKIDRLTANSTLVSTIYMEGCAQKGVEYMDVGRGATVGIVLAVIELLAVVFACFLARSIRYSYETV